MSGLVRRWLRRRSRAPRPLRAVLALLCGTAALAILAEPHPQPARGQAAPGPLAAAGGSLTTGPATPSKSPLGPGPGEPHAYTPTSPAMVAEGRILYRQGCSSCHGLALQGRPGVAPSLTRVGAGAVDFYLSTGRMPLSNPRQQPMRTAPHYSPAQIRALVAYVSSFGGPPAPVAEPARGDLALGLHVFTLNCAGCHQIVARGGLTIGAVVPDLQSANAEQIAEAVRMGPYLMPHFDHNQIDQHELNSLVRYVLWTRHPADAGGWGIYNLGPIPEGIVAWFLALAALVLVARLIGERTTT
jgi:ubiquinol-cytochrome c reductase cytochrome c subunit